MKLKPRVLILLFLTQISISANDELSINGFVSQGFFSSKNYNLLSEKAREGSWEMREVGLNFQKVIKNRFRIGVQLLSRDVGVYGNNKVVIDWAYGNLFLHDMLNISAGRNKMDVGLYTSVQDFDFLTPYAMMPSVIYDKGVRTIISSIDGIKLDGIFNLHQFGILRYSFGVGTADNGKETDYAALSLSQGVANVENANIDLLINPYLLYSTPINNLDILFSIRYYRGFSFEHGDYLAKNITIDMEGNLFRLHSAINYKIPNLELIFEYLYSKNFADLFIHEYQITVDDTKVSQGGYVGINITPLDFFSIGGYYQMFWEITNDEKLNKEGKSLNDVSNVNRDGAMTVAFNVKNSLVIKLEGHLVYGTAKLSKAINQNNPFTDDFWQYGIVKVTYNF